MIQLDRKHYYAPENDTFYVAVPVITLREVDVADALRLRQQYNIKAPAPERDLEPKNNCKQYTWED